MAFFNLGLQELIVLAVMGLGGLVVGGVVLLVIFVFGRSNKNDDD